MSEEGKCKKMELAKGEKNFLKNVVEDLRELGKLSIKYKEIYEFEDENLSLVCSSFQNCSAYSSYMGYYGWRKADWQF